MKIQPHRNIILSFIERTEASVGYLLGKEFSIEDIGRNIKLTAGFAVNMAVCRKYRKVIIILLRNNGASLGIARQKHFAGSGGVTYSQPFELRYSGRVDKPVPDWALWIFRTEPGQKVYEVLSFPHLCSRCVCSREDKNFHRG